MDGNQNGKNTNPQGAANAASMEDKDPVGYGRPPKEYQFKKGQSGNPKGRPKKFIPISVKEWLIYISTLSLSAIQKMAKTDMAGDQALALSIFKNALKCDKSAVKTVTEIIGKTNAKEYIELKLQDEEKKTAAEKESAEINHHLLVRLREDLYGKPLNQELFEAPMTQKEEAKLKDYLYTLYRKNTERKIREEHHIEAEDNNFDETVPDLQ